MKKLITICAAVTVVLAVSGVVQAALYTYDVSPADLGDKDSWGSNVPFGYDGTGGDRIPIGTDAMGGAPWLWR